MLKFEFPAQSNAVYVVERSTTLTNWTEIARNDDLTTRRSLAVSNDSAMAFFRLRRTNDALVAFGLSVSEQIDLNGHNLETDSFDSSNPLYSTWSRYEPAKRRDNGSVHAQRGITNSGAEGFGQARIYGRVATGPSAPIAIGTNGFIGSFYANSPGQIQEGWMTNKAGSLVPVVDRPTFVSPTGPDRDKERYGILYRFVFNTGDYVVDPFTTLTKTVAASGAASRIHLAGSRIIMTNATDVFRVWTNSSVVIYADGGQALFGGVGIVNPNTATNFIFYGSNRCTNVVYRGTAEFNGIIYAPAADIEIGCDANTPIDINGAIIGKSIKLIGPVRVHLDENLLHSGPMR